MCKKVGEINGIPQYELCSEYKNVKSEVDDALQRFDEARYALQMLAEKFENLRREHCPIDRE